METGLLKKITTYTVYLNGVFLRHSVDGDNIHLFWGDLKLPEISITDLRESIKKLKAKKSVSFDNIPSHILKGCMDIFAEPFSYLLFNLSIKHNTFPEILKQAMVIPIHI